MGAEESDKSADQSADQSAGRNADNDAPSKKFLRSLLAPDHPAGGHRELGSTPLARQLGLADDQMGGHWCSRCEGIWYGCTLEVQCPRCGNRRG